ncbi:hypothetical protein [Oceanithermus sp.]|uniref:hypothetical protein n=1 Tax=Oceanithermus sp. TaxID=2268145 RepID=UPI00257CF5C7|nr:hypothetical protein [Oceanithermus sp.]
MRKFILLALSVVSALLAGCGEQPPASQGNEASVTFAISFPSSAPEAPRSPFSRLLRPAGVPAGVNRAEVTITPAGGNPITVTLTPSNNSQTVTLAHGTYTFTTSVYLTDQNSNTDIEVAWGEQTEDIQGDTTVNLSVRTIVRDVQVFVSGAPINAGDWIKATLFVGTGSTGYLNFQVPDVDYDAQWSVADATDTVSGSRLGATVSWGGSSDPIELTVSVTGLGPNHNTTTITKTVSIYPFSEAGSALTVNGTLTNWPQQLDGYTIQPRASSFDGSGTFDGGNPGTIQASSGDFSYTLYDGAALGANARGALTQFEILFSSCTNTSWSDAPDPAVIAVVYTAEIANSNGTQMGDAHIQQSGSTPGNNFAEFWYADRATRVIGTANCPENIQFYLDLQPGWNWLTSTTSDDGSGNSVVQVNGGPITQNPFSPPSGWEWQYSINFTDYALSAATTNYTPTEGTTFTIEFSVANQGTNTVSPIDLSVSADAGLTVTGATGGTWDGVTNTLTLSDPIGPGNSTTVQLTLTAASGTAGQSLSLSVSLPPDDATSNDTWSFTITPQAAQSNNANVGIALDLNPPSAYFMTPNYGETIDASQTSYTIQLHASDSEGSVSEVELYLNFQPIASLTGGDLLQDTSDPTIISYTLDPSSLSPGSYDLTAIVYDAANNSSRGRTSFTIQ